MAGWHRVVFATCLIVATSTLVCAQRGAKKSVALSRAQIKEAELRLAELGYWTGSVDGVFDPGSRAALVAFQKWEGRPVTAKLTLDELEAIRTGESPKARDAGYGHVEVDIASAEVSLPKLPKLELCGGSSASVNGLAFAKNEDAYTVPIRFSVAPAKAAGIASIYGPAKPAKQVPTR